MAGTYDLDQEIASLQTLKQEMMQVASAGVKFQGKGYELAVEAAKTYARLARLQAELQGVLKPSGVVTD